MVRVGGDGRVRRRARRQARRPTTDDTPSDDETRARSRQFDRLSSDEMLVALRRRSVPESVSIFNGVGLSTAV
ncbi:unnamed protein product [Angiostrongylus costaricensis]|uniref:Sigma70_r1_2 domain-containing protein n=1 Tax=Angiostrongylus costaricensis TaxID=334426 RepID=A0A0R3PE97_ANGCS|nr:unnamed protein product [Angiostrongylus costaricensis]